MGTLFLDITIRIVRFVPKCNLEICHSILIYLQLDLKLNDAVKKLTALTVILMLPTLIASHFGMNFAFMPELNLWWAYPAVVVFQIVFMGIGFAIFRKIGWL